MSDQPDTPYILVVDDDWMSRELLETYLKMGGYRVGLPKRAQMFCRQAV
jgi:CheY-like chemotaxis protein